MKKIIAVLLLIALIFSATSFVLANSAINLWFLPGQSNEVKGERTYSKICNFPNK